jgi:hypothetical protein
MKRLVLVCALFATATGCHAATRFNLAQAQAPKECVTDCDSANFSCSKNCGLSGACVAQCNAKAAACKATCSSAK